MQERIPRDAACILDVGCAAGAFGAAIKARQDCLVVGIECNSLLTETAKTRLDQVVRGDVEELALTTFPAEFDCIVCGDVLEHLRDPWAVVTKLTAWLKPGGLLVATLPNVGHWSIVYDLLRGRWDVIPFGLLCWSHFRFFTRVGVEHLFAGSQLTIETLEGIAEALSPAGEAFLQQAVMLMADSDQESLRTVEFVVTARKRTQAG
ncbi:MAG: class I SAM-dependent methyltransferase [Candidatus Binatia bacterium]